MRIGVVIVAAGRSERLRLAVRKPYLELAGRPIFLRTLDAFASMQEVSSQVLVVNKDDYTWVTERWKDELRKLRVCAVTVGGESRQESVRRGVEKVPPSCDWLAIHDAVRPFLRREALLRVFNAAKDHGAAILAVSVKETVKKVSPRQEISGTIPRNELWLAQTPQVFPREEYMAVSERALTEGWAVTDDAQLFEMAGRPVRLVEGDYENIKITTESDLALAQALSRRWFIQERMR